MKNYLLLLAAAALIGQTNRVTAQTTASSQGQTLDHLFSTVIRSSDVNPTATTNPPVRSIPMKEADLRRYCEKIDKDIQRIFFLNDHRGKMKVQIRGIYRHGGVVFICLRLNNRSYLDYDVDSIAFQIAPAGKNLPADQTSQGTAKDAVQRKSGDGFLLCRRIAPFYVFDSVSMIPGRSRLTSIFAFQNFTLPPGRKLSILVGEKNGSRNLEIRAGNWTVKYARPV